MAGHGWGGKTTKMKIQWRVVALEDSKRVWKAPTRGRGKKPPKYEEKHRFFMKSTFPRPFSAKVGPDGSKNHEGADSNLKISM